jgi:osmotically-inducible protein OsmY
MRYHVRQLSALLLSLMLTAGCITVSGEGSQDLYKDATITTAVKSQLALNERVGTLRSIDVKTIKGTVYLGGTAVSSKEKARAEQIARKVNGVEEVVNDISIQEPRAKDE